MRIAVAAILGVLAVGARASDLAERAERSYAVDTAGSTTKLAVGGRGVLAIAIRCEPGVHVQSQAPLRVRLSASPGLVLTKDRLGWSDVAGPNTEPPRFEVAFTANARGSQAVKARLELFVCSSKWCVRREREVELPVVVDRAPRGAVGITPVESGRNIRCSIPKPRS